jgi:integrase
MAIVPSAVIALRTRLSSSEITGGAIERARRDAGIATFTGHTLRHVFGSWALADGHDLATGQKLYPSRRFAMTTRWI